MPAASRETGNFISLHGRRLGMVGDPTSNPTGYAAQLTAGQTSTALVFDGVPVLSTRPDIVAVAVGSNGAGAITVAGAVVGDTVTAAVNLTTPAVASASFESTVSVAGQVQQTSASNLSGSTFLFLVRPRS